MSDIVIPALIGVALIAVIGIVFTTLYRRSTRDEAFVRTGLGGKRVVLDGGAVVLPIFHSTARVNLKTLRLQVERTRADSLITKDRLRVDIGAEFYVRVRPDAESIALAARRWANSPTMPRSCVRRSRPNSSTACARSRPRWKSSSCRKSAATSSSTCRRRSRPTSSRTGWSWNRCR